MYTYMYACMSHTYTCMHRVVGSEMTVVIALMDTLKQRYDVEMNCRAQSHEVYDPKHYVSNHSTQIPEFNHIVSYYKTKVLDST